MTSELHELRAILAQALNKIDLMLSYSPNPYLPILTAWLGQASDHEMMASQLYAHVKSEFRDHDLPSLTQQDIAQLLRFLGYTNRRTAAGMRWVKP